MFVSIDLSVMEEEASKLLNDPYYRLTDIGIACSEETAYTSANLTFTPVKERQERRFERYLERLVLTAGLYSKRLDEILDDSRYRLIKKYVFSTKEGTIIVVDYQLRKVG